MRHRRASGSALALALALAATWAIGASDALAAEVSGAELRRLAARAERDPRALVDLRAVVRVDGRPFDARRVLADGGRDALRARLRTLAADPPPAGRDFPSRRVARDVLADERFEPTAIPRPLAGLLAEIGEAVAAVGRFIERLAGGAPGGPGAFWGALALVVLVAASWVAARVGRRRVLHAEGAGRSARRARPRPEDPEALEGEAERAEREGALARALRLRFRAGLLRLDAVGLIDFRPSLPNSEIARMVGSPAFRGLARTFDEVTYGGRPPAPQDLEASRRDWATVLSETARS